MGQLAEHIRDQWAATPEAHQTGLFQLFQLALSRADEARKSSVGKAFAAQLFSQPDAGVAVLKSLEDVPSEELRAPLIAELVQVGGQHAQQRDDAVTLIRKYGGEEAGGSLGDMVFVATQHGDGDGAIEMLDHSGDLLGSRHEQIADQILSWSEGQASGGRTPAWPVFARLAASITGPEQQERLANLFLPQLRVGNEVAITALAQLKDAGARGAQGAVLSKAVSSLAGAPTDPALHASAIQTLTAIAPYVHRLSPDHQDELGQTIIEWLDSSPLRDPAIAAIRSMSRLRAEVARALVAKLIEIDKTEEDLGARTRALAAAGAISGPPRARATRELTAYLAELERGTDDDRGVLGSLGQGDGSG